MSDSSGCSVYVKPRDVGLEGARSSTLESPKSVINYWHSAGLSMFRLNSQQQLIMMTSVDSE